MSPAISKKSASKRTEHLGVTFDEARVRLKSICGVHNWMTGFPASEFARRIGVDRRRFNRFRRGEVGLGAEKFAKLVDLLLKIEDGRVSCYCERKNLIKEKPWMLSTIKHITESDTPTKNIRPIHSISMSKNGIGLSLGMSKQAVSMPKFMEAFKSGNFFKGKG